MIRAGSVVCALLLALPSLADEPVRVYTNADLATLPPIATSPPPVEQGPGWEFVIDFLAEQRARIDADRAYEMDSALVDESVRRSREPERPRYVLPYNYWNGYGPSCRGGACGPHRPGAAPRPLPGGPRNSIVPLHARRPIR
jgi:hypothetical protein